MRRRGSLRSSAVLPRARCGARSRASACGASECSRIGLLRRDEPASERSQGLQQLGWSDGCNPRIDIRWATHEDVGRHAADWSHFA
jgi:hypothetical protein